MASKKGGGTTRMNRDSNSQRLGVKKYGLEAVFPGNIIVRQKGNKFHSGDGTKQGNDFTIYAIREGKVSFIKRLGKQLIKVI